MLQSHSEKLCCLIGNRALRLALLSCRNLHEISKGKKTNMYNNIVMFTPAGSGLELSCCSHIVMFTPAGSGLELSCL